MSLTSADIITLVSTGCTVAIAADGGITITPPEGKRQGSNAERCRRYRMSKHVGSMSDHVESVSRHANDMVPSPPPSPPLSPLHPPLPPTPTPTPVRENARASASAQEAELVFEPEKPLKLSVGSLTEAVATGIQSLYRRRPGTPWSEKEVTAARRFLRPMDEADLLADLRLFGAARAAGWTYYRKDILTLMNNWPAERERADDYLRNNGRAATPVESGHNPYAEDHLAPADRSAAYRR